MNKRLLIVAALALFALTACKGDGNAAVQRRRAERFGAAPTPAQVATVAPTSEPTTAPIQHASGDIEAAARIDPDGDIWTQLIGITLLVGVGIPAFWTVSLRKRSRV